MNRATQILLENALCQYGCMDYADEDGNIYIYDASDIQCYYTDQLEDCSDLYDEEWYPLVGTPAINATIDWTLIANAVSQQNKDYARQDASK